MRNQTNRDPREPYLAFEHTDELLGLCGITESEAAAYRKYIDPLCAHCGHPASQHEREEDKSYCLGGQCHCRET